MRATIERRLAVLEQRKNYGGRRVHVVKAADDADRERQMADLLAAGVIGLADGFLCITGKPRRTDDFKIKPVRYWIKSDFAERAVWPVGPRQHYSLNIC